MCPPLSSISLNYFTYIISYIVVGIINHQPRVKVRLVVFPYKFQQAILYYGSATVEIIFLTETT